MSGTSAIDTNTSRLVNCQQCSLDSKASYSIHLEKDLYYTGDQLSGYIDIRTSEATTLSVLHVAIVCRVRWNGGGEDTSSQTLYSNTKIIGRDYPIMKGQTQIPFTFGLPDDVALSSDHALYSIKWDARLVESDWTPVTFLRFTMSALYYAQTTIGPRVQQEVEVKRGNPTFRAEVSLSRDVYRDGEPIDVRLAMHRNGAVVKSVKTCITQHVLYYSGVEGDYKELCQTTMDHSELRHLSGKKNWSKIGSTAGSTCIRMFSCTPHAPEGQGKQVAVQKMKDSDGRTYSTLLVPSTTAECTETLKSISVSYSLDTTIQIRGGKKVHLSVPFTLQGNLPRDLNEYNSPVEIQNCFTFAISVEQPPVYDNYNTASVKSYTCLRPESESLDSLFALAQMTSVPEKKRRFSLKTLPSLRSVIEGRHNGDNRVVDEDILLSEMGVASRANRLFRSQSTVSQLETSHFQRRHTYAEHLPIGTTLSCTLVE
ncbi:hypothetical protein SARC_09306 [Sphaeroforma arctica JP610]|uniref:Uncharacterized protein n=1 Tax=Sphaeroforma arctica JP610 TaxID=667725 RepID=A0A0L0FNG2_9EUKA|nr:hypothetical protein SARC_09306 [Sphaeroforma arctica JP610]KNC78259.1 hypothetical protein SARC_09306 [Sphaeroforma arctica JP610]|eukprot:XP_014152161.1 hypothetical protein SARC_09306 [Sphaeroforma arctica JP610]